MPKKLLVVFLVIIFTSLVAIGYFSTKIFFSQKISYRSEYNGYDLRPANSKQLEGYINAVHFWDQDRIPSGRGDPDERLTAKKLEVVLTSQEQPYDKLVSPVSANEVYSSWGIDAAFNGAVTIKIYLNLDLLKNTTISSDGLVNGVLYKTLYEVAQGTNRGDKFIELSQTAAFEPTTPEKFFVNIEKKKNILEKLIGLVVPTAYAQICQGNIECGTWNQAAGTCVGGPREGQICWTNSECPGGYCDLPDPTCEAQGNLTTCSSLYNNQNECNANDPDVCGIFNCVAQRTCSWNPGGGTPPPTPTPTPEPTPTPPPSGGTCDSSCGTCGIRIGGNCSTDNYCCHRRCNSGICQTVFGTGNNACDNEGGACGGGTPTPTPGATPTPTPTPPPTCSVNLSPTTTVTIAVGAVQPYVANPTVIGNATVTRVDFSNSPGVAATISPTSDTTSPYFTQARGVAEGSTNIGATAILSSGGSCQSPIRTLNVVAPAAWWRAKNGDILTNGSISSIIPGNVTNRKLILDGPVAGFPGVAVFGSNSSVSPGDPEISSTNWNAAAGYNFAFDEYNYNAITQLGPQVDCADPNIDPNQTLCYNIITMNPLPTGQLLAGRKSKGYYWQKWFGPGNLQLIGNSSLGNEKIILMVDSNLYLGTTDANSPVEIKLNDGIGFFMAAVSGDIFVMPQTGNNVNAANPTLKGLYIANGQFQTRSRVGGPQNDLQLWLRGGVAAGGGISLTRNLENQNDNPAEYFEFGPELLLSWPRELTKRQLIWHEIAP